MIRRCKIGGRARIVVGRNSGKVVLVVRHYLGEVFDDATWPLTLFPWVVVSLGAPLRAFYRDTGVEAPLARTIVLDDCDLEPIDDDDESDSTGRDVGRPIVAGTAVGQSPAPAMVGAGHG